MAKSELKVRALDKVAGEIEVPGDKSMSHRVAILAGISNGPCRVKNFLPSEDCVNTLRAMEALGVEVEVLESNAHGPVEMVINGKKMEATGEKPGCAPLVIHGSKLQPTTYEMPVASAQVKSAILLAGLFAEGKTTVVQPAECRDHTERMLAQFRVRTRRDGDAISVYGGQMPESTDLTVPGDSGI